MKIINKFTGKPSKSSGCDNEIKEATTQEDYCCGTSNLQPSCCGTSDEQQSSCC
ncbi:hypothetical protein [Cytobacillus sp.]|uniref:hypothetical protein n=1 Tax=Cytobacillus sp. TaxID=2675269 RepID=UPI00351229AF